MCKEDVRIARKAFPNNGGVFGSTSQDTRIMQANGNRFSLSVAAVANDISSLQGCMLIYSRVGNQTWPLVVLTVDKMSAILNIKDVGLPLTYDIYYHSFQFDVDDGPIACETQFIDDLEDV